jgi:hypothetical protein
VVLQDVGVNTVPEKFDGALDPIGRKYARPAELKELQTAVAGNESSDIKLTGGVESAILFSERLAQQPISTNHGWPVQGTAIVRRMALSLRSSR